MKSRVRATVAVTLLVAGSTACAGGGTGGAPTVAIRFPMAVPDTHPRMVHAKAFAAAIASRSGGRLDVRTFPGGELYGAREAVRSAALGDVEMAMEPETHFITFDAAFRALDVPFQFDTTEAFQTFVRDRFEPLVAPSLEKAGLTLVACWDEGPMILAGRSRLPRSPDDFSGLKIRSSGHDLLARSWNDMGAATVNIPIHEVYTAMQQGVAEAIFTTFNTFVSGKTYEVAPKVVRWPVRSVYVWVVNKGFWDRLAESDRVLIREAASTTTTEYNRAIWANYDQLVATVRGAKNGEFYELTPADLDRFRARLNPLLATWAGEFGHVFAPPRSGS